MDFATSITFSIILAVITSIAANLFFIGRALLNRKAKKATRDSDIVLNFLQKQGERTKKIQESKFLQYAQLDKKACTFRMAYLKIEEKALENNTEARDYYITINRNLAKLLSIYNKAKPDTKLTTKQICQDLRDKADEFLHDNKQQTRRQEIYAEIDAFITRVNNDNLPPDQITALANKILEKIAAFDDVDERIAMKKALLTSDFSSKALQHTDAIAVNAQNAAIHTETMHENLVSQNMLDDNTAHKINLFSSENAELRKQLDFLRTELQALKNSSHQDSTTNASLDSLQDISDQIIDTNEKEIKKLRTTVRNQKIAISELEEMLNKARKNPGANHDLVGEATIKTEMGKLNRCLQESETCIEMLEKELNTLKAKLANQHTSPTPNDEDLDALKRNLQQVRAELEDKIVDQGRKNDELKFVYEALAANSIEDFSLLIFESFSALDCQPNLMIFTKGKSIDMAATGSLSALDKTLITALRNEEINRDKEANTVLFRYPHIGGLLRLKHRQDGKDPLDDIISLAKLADRFIDKISAAQAGKQLKKQLDSCANSVKQAAHDIDKLCELNLNTTKKSVETGFTQIQNSARTKNIPVAFISTIKTTEQETLDDISSNNSLRLKIRKEFLTLVKRLEDIN